jgi:hypothetical protein
MLHRTAAGGETTATMGATGRAMTAIEVLAKVLALDDELIE